MENRAGVLTRLKKSSWLLSEKKPIIIAVSAQTVRKCPTPIFHSGYLPSVDCPKAFCLACIGTIFSTVLCSIVVLHLMLMCIYKCRSTKEAIASNITTLYLSHTAFWKFVAPSKGRKKSWCEPRRESVCVYTFVPYVLHWLCLYLCECICMSYMYFVMCMCVRVFLLTIHIVRLCTSPYLCKYAYPFSAVMLFVLWVWIF